MKELQSIDHAQRLFLLTSGDGFSCWGFDNAKQETALLAQRLGQPVLPFEDGDQAVLEEHARLMVLFRESPVNKATWFGADVPKSLQKQLELARKNGMYCRVWYGDNKTGRSWMEENDCVGRIGRSMGPMRVPLLVPKGEDGGGALLCSSIVRLDHIDAIETMWQHPAFHVPDMTIRVSHDIGYQAEVLWDESVQARFKTFKNAAAYVAFMYGFSYQQP